MDGAVEIVKVASNVSTPLALSGILIAFLFLLFRGIIALKIFPTLSAAVAGSVLLKIIHYLFILSLVAIILGVFGYVIVTVAKPPAVGSTPSADIVPDETFFYAADTIAKFKGASVSFASSCSEDVPKIKVKEARHLEAGTYEALIRRLKYYLSGSVTPEYNVTWLQGEGLFVIECIGTSAPAIRTGFSENSTLDAQLPNDITTPTETRPPSPTPGFGSHKWPKDITSSIGMRLHWVDLLHIWVGETEVSQPEFREVMGTNPSRYRSETRPVDKVCLETAKTFCQALTSRD